METNKAGFEIETCGRCGGGGSYSYNAMHGSTCYGCGGTGKRFTKRGAAARAAFLKSQERPVAELAPGDFVWYDIGKGKWLPLVRKSESGSCSIQTVDGVEVRKYYIDLDFPPNVQGRRAWAVFPEQSVRSVRNDAELKSLLQAALDFQATLNVQGKPSKQSKSAAIA